MCAPSYTGISVDMGVPRIASDLDLPVDRIEMRNLPLRGLATEIKRSQIVLASLGGEDGPVSYLDGHALGVPVLSGDDIIGKYSNPEGTGLRCTTAQECELAIEFLLNKPEVRKRMGELGRLWINMNGLTEDHQRAQIQHVLAYLQLLSEYDLPRKLTKQSDAKFSFRHKIERLEVKAIQHMATWLPHSPRAKTTHEDVTSQRATL
jgi:hypothetical protein